MKKTLSEMSASELREAWLEAPKAIDRMAALREIERRKLEQPKKVRAAVEVMIDTLGLPEALAVIAEICQERAESEDYATAFMWTSRMDVVRNAAEETQTA